MEILNVILNWRFNLARLKIDENENIFRFSWISYASVSSDAVFIWNKNVNLKRVVVKIDISTNRSTRVSLCTNFKLENEFENNSKVQVKKPLSCLLLFCSRCSKLFNVWLDL